MPSWVIGFDRRVRLNDFELIRKIAEAEAAARLIHEIPLRASVQIEERSLLAGRDPRAQLWARVSRKTMTRDLGRLEAMGLITRVDGIIRPRLDVMKQFWG